MGAFTYGTVTRVNPSSNGKTVEFSVTGPASYDANGSVIDLSVATRGAWEGFTVLYDVEQVSIGAHGNDKYRLMFVPGSSGAAATGTLKVRDLTAASDAEASGDLSGVTFYLRATGR
jgi:hypothetical protein